MREARMTFGEHLEELRRRILVSLVWLALSTAVCFTFYSQLVGLSMKPHEHAVSAAMRKRHFVVIEQTARRLDPLMASEGPWTGLFAAQIKDQVARRDLASKFDGLAASLGPHLPAQSRDAVQTIVTDFGLDFSRTLTDILSPSLEPIDSRGYGERFEQVVSRLESIADEHRPSALQRWLGLGVDFESMLGPLKRFTEFLDRRRDAELANPPALTELAARIESDPTAAEVGEIHAKLADRVRRLEEDRPQPITVIKYTEAFMTSFKIALIFGILFALPLILYEAWKFVGAGLYEHEQKYVLIFFPFSMGLFISGAFFGYKWMVPFGLQFLASWGAEFAELSFTLENYVGLFFTLTIVLGLVFQTPLVMIFLNKIDVVSSAGFAAARRYTLLGAVVFSTLVTPPDPLSWSLMAGPIMVLYELGIRICRVLEKREAERIRRESAADAS